MTIQGQTSDPTNVTGGFCPPRESGRILAAILERSEDAVIRADLNGVILGWSVGASRLYGYASEDAVGSSVQMLIPEERRTEFAELIADIRAGRAINHRETVRRAKDGRLVHVVLSMLPIVDSAGQTVSVLSVARDITIVKHAEAALRISEARWRSIIDSAIDAIIVIDAKGTIESFNAGAERLFGYRAGEIVGRSVNILMPPPYRDDHHNYLANYLAGAPAKVIGIGRQVTARRRNGEDFPARLAVGELSVDGQTRFTGIVHDLTERVQMETRLRETTALAKLGEMAAIVAHEFRNALAAVRGAIQVIGARLPQDSRDRSAVREVIARIDALTNIVREMLLFAHLPQPEWQSVHVGSLITSIASFAEHDPTLHAVKIELVGEAPPIRADSDLLRIVFTNLFTNGAQAMHGTGTIQVLTESAGQWCQIIVSDTGPGIPPDVRARLFTPFFTTKARGTGLGLATARRIVEAHGGTLDVQCPSTGGTTVVVRLPKEDMRA